MRVMILFLEYIVSVEAFIIVLLSAPLRRANIGRVV